MEINAELDKESPPKKTNNFYHDQFPNKNYYQALFEDAPIGIVLADTDGVLIRVNRAVCNMLGYSEEELDGMNLKDISYPEDMKVNIAHREKLIAGDTNTFQMEKRYIHKDGHIVWGKLTASTLESNDDNESYLMAHLEDITPQKNAEKSFREVEFRYQALFMDAPLSLLEIDMSKIKSYLDDLISKDITDLRNYLNNNFEEIANQAQKIKITNANEATLNLFKAKNKDDFTGKLNTILNEKALSSFLKGLINFIESSSENTFQLCASDLEGNEIELIVTMFIAPEHQKTWSRVLCTNLDITRLKKKEAALRETEDKYKKLIEIANDAIFVVDAISGRITEANKKAATIVGSSRQKLVGTLFSNLFYVDSLDITSKDIELLIEKKGGHIREVMLKNSKDKLIPIELSSSVVRIGKKNFVQSTARDLSEHYRSRELRKALDTINKSIHSTLDFKKIMQRLVSEACETLGDTVGIFIRDDRYWVAEYFEGSLSNIRGVHFTEDEIRAATLAENSRAPIVSNDTFNDDRFSREMMKVSKMRSLLLVPLIIKDEVIGGLCFAYSKEPVPFNEVEIDFGVKLGATVGLAIENARMYGSEHQIADTLQEALLSMPPKIEGIEFGHLYESSTEIAKVGGDFFDIFEIDEEIIGLLIGDVSGKGLGAASLTSIVKNSVRAYAVIEKSPSSITGMASELIRKTHNESMYVSIFFGTFNRKTGNLIYCCAGHPPPIVRHASSGKTRFLHSTSTVIGQFSKIDFKESEIELLEDDLLFTYTDGLTEARNGDEFFGEERLSNSIIKNKKLATSDLPKAVFKEAKDFADDKLLDDIAILTLSPKKRSK